MKNLLLTHIKKMNGLKTFSFFMLIVIFMGAFFGINETTMNATGIIFSFLIILQIVTKSTTASRVEGIQMEEDILLNSLPINRSQIVLSRYLFIFIFSVIGLLSLILYNFIFGIVIHKPLQINIVELFIIFTFQFVYNIIFVPLEFLDNKKLLSIKIIFYLGAITLFAISGLKQINFYSFVIVNGLKLLPIIIFAVMLLCIPISIYLSIRIYSKKEF